LQGFARVCGSVPTRKVHDSPRRKRAGPATSTEHASGPAPRRHGSSDCPIRTEGLEGHVLSGVDSAAAAVKVSRVIILADCSQHVRQSDIFTGTIVLLRIMARTDRTMPEVSLYTLVSHRIPHGSPLGLDRVELRRIRYKVLQPDVAALGDVVPHGLCLVPRRVVQKTQVRGRTFGAPSPETR